MPQAPVAGFNPFQEQAFSQIQGMQGMAQPYFNMGQNYLQQSAAPITGADVSQYYNPMAQNVTNQMQNIFGQQQRQATGAATQSAGGIGADRIAVAQGNLANQQGLAAGQTYAGLYQQALQAAQQQKQMSAGAGYGLAQMGPAAQAAALQGTTALGQAGQQQQQLTQAQLNAPYQQQLAQIAYPFQTAQYLAGITGGLAPALGGTTNGQGSTTYPTPSPLSQALGVGAAGIGLAGSAGMFGGSGGKGSSTLGAGSTFTPTGEAPMDASGGYVNYGFRRGGRMALGGDPESDSENSGDQPEPFPGISIPKGHGLSPVPYIPLQSGSGQFHNNLNLSPPKQSSGSDAGSALGSAAKIAATVLPFFLARGGSVSPYDMGQGFDEGGDVGESWEPPIDVPYETAGARAPDPHFTMGDLASRAKDYYTMDRIAPVDKSSPFNVQNWTGSGDTAQAAAPPSGGDAENTTPPYVSPAAPQPYQNPNLLDRFGGLPSTLPQQQQQQASVPMPQPRPDIAGPAGQGHFSPETPPLTPQQIAQETMRAATERGIPVDLALRLVRRESGFRNIRGAAGEYGPTQLMPGTAREMGVSDPSNTYLNIHGGMDYLKKMHDRYGNWDQAVAAYNAGPGNVDRGRIPSSTRAYVADVNGDGKVDVNDLSAKERTGSPYEGHEGSPVANRDMSMATEQMPRGQQPYPDATDRDWGQKAARSPWMALVKAGAAMASSVGPIGSVIGKGIAAGAGELDSQRKELRSEEDINNKAGALYQQAKQHLNQYQRMTPYQQTEAEYHRDIAARTRYQPANMEIADPETGKTSIKSVRFNPQTGVYEDPETGKQVSGRLIARQTGDESATSRSTHALSTAKDDPAYASDQVGTINKHRVMNGLPPLPTMGQTKETAIPDPGEKNRKKGVWYINPITHQPDLWTQ